jgi:hypothetical protein
MTSVLDIGTVVNPKTARSQIIGGIVFGIGMALLEGSHLEETTGRYANGNFADYLVATNADVPYIDVHFIGKPDTIFNPIGAGGAGEIGVTGTPQQLLMRSTTQPDSVCATSRSRSINCFYQAITWKELRQIISKFELTALS